MPQSNQILPVNLNIVPGQRKAFFRVENHKGWPTDDPVAVVEKHRDVECERLGPGRYALTWGDRDIPEQLWITVQVGSYGRERATVRLNPVGEDGKPIEVQVAGDGESAA